MSDDGAGDLNFDAQACTTVGEYIADVIMKELCGLWLRHDAPSFNAQAISELMARIGPSVASDILETARSWIPSLSDISLDELVPDLHQYPNPIEDAQGMDLKQQQLVLESLDVILTNMDFGTMREFKRVPTQALPRPLTFPKDYVARIAAQITVVFERICLNRSNRREYLGVDVGDEDEFKRQDAAQVVSGSKQELIFQLQTARRRIFDMERELVTKERGWAEKMSWEIKEREKKVSSLMEVNVFLEEKLRQRTEENRQAELHLMDAQRRVEHGNALLEDRRRQTEKLETALAKSCRMQEDILEREKEHGRRILRSRVDEHVTIVKDRLRITQLRKTLRSPFGAEGDAAEQEVQTITERDLTDMASEALGNVTDEFEEFFLRRQEKFEEMLADYEMKLEDKKRQYEVLTGQIARDEQASFGGPSRLKNAAVQTTFASMSSPTSNGASMFDKNDTMRTTRRTMGKAKTMRETLLQGNVEMPPLFSPTQKRVSTPSTRASSIQPSRATSRCDNSRPGSRMDNFRRVESSGTPRQRPLPAPVFRSSSRAESGNSDYADGKSSPTPFQKHQSKESSPSRPGSARSEGSPPPAMPAPPPSMPMPPE